MVFSANSNILDNNLQIWFTYYIDEQEDCREGRDNPPGEEGAHRVHDQHPDVQHQGEQG